MTSTVTAPRASRVQIQFKAKGTSTYKTIKTVTLGKKSEVTSKIKHQR